MVITFPFDTLYNNGNIHVDVIDNINTIFNHTLSDIYHIKLLNEYSECQDVLGNIISLHFLMAGSLDIGHCYLVLARLLHDNNTASASIRARAFYCTSTHTWMVDKKAFLTDWITLNDVNMRSKWLT